jgi:hypothetical protein
LTYTHLREAKEYHLGLGASLGVLVDNLSQGSNSLCLRWLIRIVLGRIHKRNHIRVWNSIQDLVGDLSDDSWTLSFETASGDDYMGSRDATRTFVVFGSDERCEEDGGFEDGKHDFG